jgi:hypothetical protein
MGAPSRRLRFETRVIPHSVAVDAVEAQLDNALLAMVGGARRSATLNQVCEALSRDYQLEADAVQVRRFHAEGFLLVFHDRAVADRVLHAEPPEGAVLHLIFRRWHRQLGALFSPMFFKVLLSIENIPTHVWSMEVAQTIVGSSCLIFDASPASADGSNMSQFLAVAWVVHPNLIPNEVGCIVPEPQEPFVDRQLPLFLRASEINHSKRDTLGFRALMKILEVHKFSPQAGSSDDGSSSELSSSSGGDRYPRPVRHSSLRPWPVMY